MEWLTKQEKRILTLNSEFFFKLILNSIERYV